MDLTNDDIDFIENCFAYFLVNEEQFVTYDEHMATSKRAKEIIDKITNLKCETLH